MEDRMIGCCVVPAALLCNRLENNTKWRDFTFIYLRKNVQSVKREWVHRYTVCSFMCAKVNMFVRLPPTTVTVLSQ